MLKFLALALLVGAASAGVTSDAAPRQPLCRVTAQAESDHLPGIYTVTVRVAGTLSGKPCANGYALVQFDGGRTYPLSAVRAGEPYVRSGIPWYWRLYWLSASGKRYRVPLPGFYPPFADPSP